MNFALALESSGPGTAQRLEFTLLGVGLPGNSLGNPPVKVSQNSDPLTESLFWEFDLLGILLGILQSRFHRTLTP